MLVWCMVSMSNRVNSVAANLVKKSNSIRFVLSIKWGTIEFHIQKQKNRVKQRGQKNANAAPERQIRDRRGGELERNWTPCSCLHSLSH